MLVYQDRLARVRDPCEMLHFRRPRGTKTAVGLAGYTWGARRAAA